MHDKRLPPPPPIGRLVRAANSIGLIVIAARTAGEREYRGGRFFVQEPGRMHAAFASDDVGAVARWLRDRRREGTGG